MARAKSSSTAQLPAGFKKVEAATWDFKAQPLLVGTIVSFGKVPKKDFHDGTYVPGTMQATAKVRSDDGVVNIVFERAGLASLFDLGVGERVAIAYAGSRAIAGREKPMEDFAVGVME